MSEATCTGIRKLARQDFISPEPLSRKTHWKNYRYGRRFYDGPSLWSSKLNRKLQKSKPTKTRFESELEASNQTSRVDSLDFKPLVSEAQTNAVSQPNSLGNQIKPPILPESFTRNFLPETNKRIGKNEEILDRAIIDFEQIKTESLRNREYRSRVFLKGCNSKMWRLNQLKDFESLCEQLSTHNTEILSLDYLKSRLF